MRRRSRPPAPRRPLRTAAARTSRASAGRTTSGFRRTRTAAPRRALAAPASAPAHLGARVAAVKAAVPTARHDRAHPQRDRGLPPARPADFRPRLSRHPGQPVPDCRLRRAHRSDELSRLGAPGRRGRRLSRDPAARALPRRLGRPRHAAGGYDPHSGVASSWCSPTTSAGCASGMPKSPTPPSTLRCTPCSSAARPRRRRRSATCLTPWIRCTAATLRRGHVPIVAIALASTADPD